MKFGKLILKNVLRNKRRSLLTVSSLAVSLFLIVTLATVLSGAHYVADLFGTLAMCGVSLWFWRRFAHRWIEQAPGQGTPRVLSP